MNIQDQSTKNGSLNGQHYHNQWVLCIFFLRTYNNIWIQVAQTRQVVYNCIKQSFETLAVLVFFLSAPALKADTEQLNVFCMGWSLWTPLPTDSFKLINLSASFVTQGHALHERSLEKKVPGWSERNTNYGERCRKMNDFQSDAWKKRNHGENWLGMNCAVW